jgi:hypothetical protein
MKMVRPQLELTNEINRDMDSYWNFLSSRRRFGFSDWIV